MKKAITVVSTALILALASLGSTAAEEFEKPIKARKAMMQVYAFNLGLLGGMAKGKLPFDSKLANEAANNLLAAATMKNSAMWPQGSDSTALPGKTRAKAENWTTWPEAGKKHEAFIEAAQAMASNAGSGVDAIKANIGAVGKSCKGCHEDFREPKKK